VEAATHLEHGMLVVEGLTCRFGTKAAVDNASFSIAPGGFVGVIGRSGAGKSTLLRTINRLAQPTEGRILYDGADVTALRGKELGAEVLLKATRVDGVYSADPEKNPHAVLYPYLTFEQVMSDQLKVMDMTAIGMCMENNLPILVFNFKKEGNIERAVQGEPIGTWVSQSPRPRAGAALG